MSEPRGGNQGGEKSSINEVLNKKWGAFPVWLYLVAFGLVVFLFIYLRRQNSSQDTPVEDPSTPQVSARVLPPFINQVYTNSIPPEQSAPGPDKENKTHVIELKNAGTFDAIAKRWGMTVNQLIRLNPQLANKYENRKKKLPKGTRVRVLRKDDKDDK